MKLAISPIDANSYDDVKPMKMFDHLYIVNNCQFNANIQTMKTLHRLYIRVKLTIINDANDGNLSETMEIFHRLDITVPKVG